MGIVANGLTGANASGNSQHYHLIYAQNSAVWWTFWCDAGGAYSTISCAYSPDLTTWTRATTIALPHNIAGSADARNLGVWYASIAGVDVVHVAAASSFPALMDTRATLTATAITWGTPSEIAVATTNYATPDGTAPCVASDGGIFVNSGLPDTGTHYGNEVPSFNATADTVAASWTPGAWTSVKPFSASNVIGTRATLPLASGKVLLLYDDGNTPPENVHWGIMDRSGSTPADAAVFASSVNMASNGNDWGAVALSVTDIHCVRRTGGGTYEHMRFNGTAWATGNSIPTQQSVVGSGVALLSDGVSVWLVVIGNASGNPTSGNPVVSLRWTAVNGWANAWTALALGSATRTGISACQNLTGAYAAALLWTEGAAPGPYTLMAQGWVLTPPPPAPPLIGALRHGQAVLVTLRHPITHAVLARNVAATVAQVKQATYDPAPHYLCQLGDGTQQWFTAVDVRATGS